MSAADELREIMGAGNGAGPKAPPSPFQPRKPDVTKVRPISWVWHERVPVGTLSLLVGEEGVGKGTLLAWMTAQLSRGELPGSFYGTPARVLIVGDEDSFDDTWTPRLLAAGADLDYVRDLPASDALGLLEVRRDVEHLKRIVKAGAFRVVIFDALLDNLPDSTDEWKPRSVRAALRPLGRASREEQFASLASLHPNKSGETFRQKLSGSHAFNALARSGLLLAQHPSDEDRRVLARGKGNLSRRPPSTDFGIDECQVEVNGYRLTMPVARDFKESDLTVRDLLAPPDREQGAVDDAREFLVAELADGPVLTNALQKAANDAGVSWRSVERAKREAGVKAAKTKAGWQYEIKTATKTATCGDGGVGGVGGVDPSDGPKAAKTAKTAASARGGVDGGVDADDQPRPDRDAPGTHPRHLAETTSEDLDDELARIARKFPDQFRGEGL